MCHYRLHKSKAAPQTEGDSLILLSIKRDKKHVKKKVKNCIQPFFYTRATYECYANDFYRIITCNKHAHFYV